MKKTLIIALAGMMMFAFTQCGGNGKDNETKNETAVEETKTVNETPSSTGTKQFNDMKAGFEEIEKAINNATTCDEIEQVAMALVLSNIAIGLGGGDQYADGEKMTEKEQEKFQEMTEDLLKKAEKKAAELGCEKKEYSL
jgi:hypothetical protein